MKRSKKTKPMKVKSEKQLKIGQLERMLAYSERAIDGRSEILDDLFTNQVKKLREEMAIIKGKQ